MFDNLQERLGNIFKQIRGRGTLSEQDVTMSLREIRRALIEADVSLEVVRNFIEKIREKAIGTEILKSIKPGQMVIKIVHDELVSMLGTEEETISIQAAPPIPIMMVGLQGSGKTTTSAKLAKKFKEKENKKVLLASLDTRRPAAQEQLSQLAKQIQVDSLPIIQGQNPLEIAERAIDTAKRSGHDIVILDTAGRTHIDTELMNEIIAIKKLSNPHETLLVADSLTGQDAVNLAKSFDNAVNISGIILTRMDGDGRGGAALSMRAVTGKPIKAIAFGEKLDALENFYPKRISDRILGMGDIISLVEKAEQNIDQEKAEALAKKMQAGRFDLNDLAEQLKQMQKIGGLGSIMSMMPGISSMKNKISQAGFNDQLLIKQLAIISSMTPQERQKPEIIKHSRKQRIAKGSGTQTAEINKLLKMHRQMADMIKSVGAGKKKGFAQKLMGGLTQMGTGMGNLTNLMNNMPSMENWTENTHKQKIPPFNTPQNMLDPFAQMKNSSHLPGMPKNKNEQK